MEDTLITFKTAKIAKEKGFNEILSYHYDKTGIIQNVTTNNEKLDYGYSAPTQSLLAKWLREKHNLHVHPILQYPYYGYEIRKIQDDDKLLKEEIQIGDKFEEAYEIGLQEALKLIDNK